MTVTIAIANAKGGCGKTTTALHLAVAFAEQGLHTLAVDMDPQGTLTQQLGVTTDGSPTVREALFDGLPLRELARPSRPNLDVVGADLRLVESDLVLPHKLGADTLLRRAMRGLPHAVAVIDCPPSLGKLTVNALVAARFLLAPVDPSPYSVDGLDLLLTTFEQARDLYNAELQFLGPVLVLAEPRTIVTRAILDNLRARWRDHVINTTVRRSSKTREVAFYRETLFDVEPTTAGQDYRTLAEEIADATGLRSRVLHHEGVR